MQSSQGSVAKNRITNAIFTGIIVMLVVFVISLFLPKEWLVSGKIVVFPSGQPASASVNLAAETANTAEIIKSQSFQKEYFGDQAANFAGARVLKNSSIVMVKFRSSENDIQAYEDLIVKIPSNANDYARDLYEGSPFKYKMVSDPEISASPVRPNLLLNAIFGFIAGIILYIIYWKGLESRRSKKSEIISPEIKQEPASSAAEESAGKKAEESAEEKTGQGKVEVIDGRPHFVPGRADEAEVSAPENLPFVDEGESGNVEEPSDEEVKERLNRLMRGEL